MHNNYYYIRQLSAQLKATLTGYALTTCFSQEKDELVLGFYKEDAEFYIKAVVKPDFACLTFPNDFRRARKNSVELFTEVIDAQVLNVVQFRNERSFALVFDQNFLLLFKMHGNRSNIILFKENQAVDLFHNKLVNDLNIIPDHLHRDLDQSYAAFEKNGLKVAPLYPTFGKLVNQYLDSRLKEDIAPESKWQIIQEVVQQLENPLFYITYLDHLPVLSLLPIGAIKHSTANAIEAANLFYSLFAKINFLEKEKRDALRLLEKKKSKTENYLQKTYDKLASFENETRNEQIANIIMANLHQIPSHADAVELFDFYHNQPIRVKLKKELNPQKNAEVYYRKAKNEKIEVDKIQEAIESKEKELQTIEKHLQAVKAIEGLKELRKYLKENNLAEENTEPAPEQLFKKFEFMGYEIWIGKNAKNNDLLTQKYAHKDDLWLHAKDVSGSHVIVKNQPGKNFPEPVIEKAAGLAAYFSKMRTDSLCPVIFTPKKYVRKPKGLPEGAVVIDKEKVILIEPDSSI